MKKAVYAGSFDPMHEGHLNIIQRASKLFDYLYIVISINLSKNNQANLQTRLNLVKSQIEKLNLKNIELLINEGLTIDLAKKLGCQYLVRSIRNQDDYFNELEIAQVNHKLNNQIETIILFADPSLVNISSSTIKKLKANVERFGNQK